MVNRLVGTGRKYGMEINIDKSQVIRLSSSNESLQIKVGNRELNMEEARSSLKILTGTPAGNLQLQLMLPSWIFSLLVICQC